MKNSMLRFARYKKFVDHIIFPLFMKDVNLYKGN